MQEQAKKTLTQKVENFKLIARDALRMQLISPRLSKIFILEEEIKATTECKAKIEHKVTVEKYEISKLDTEHPNYKETKENKEKNIEYLTKEIERHNTAITDLEKNITEQKEKITKIEKGETLVSLEALNDLVDQMIREDALLSTKE